MDKLHAITENITKHDDSLFTEGGKPKTGLNCLHNFNNEKRHYIKSGVEKDVLRLVEDLDRVMATYKANMKLAPGPQHLKQEKEKAEKKGKKRKLGACENRRKRSCRVFRSLGGAPLAKGIGILQLETVDCETLHLFTPTTDKACLRAPERKGGDLGYERGGDACRKC